ncbi:MAG: carbamate kinase [Candidatus Eisenbacteria bacterium]|nr:carbamate kinase [Candidatus Eisenbacteria bacterium]
MDDLQGCSSFVVSLGGNAILPAGGGGSLPEQFSVTRATMEHVVNFLADGRRILLTHGNGPIVGNILIRNEAARDQVPPMPLDVCGADSQGGIGYMIQQTLQNLLRQRDIPIPVVTLVTQVVVDHADAAFDNPTKPIGPFFSGREAQRLREEKGWHMEQDSGRGWRRLVPSPRPLEIVELEAIRMQFEAGSVVVTVGGGGIPVVRDPGGNLAGVEAVIDKDRATMVLARSLRVDGIVIVTAVDQVALHYGTDRQQEIGRMTVSEARGYLSEGHFPPGSMGPKIEGAIDFLEAGGKAVLITSPRCIRAALDGKAGTRVVAGG